MGVAEQVERLLQRNPKFVLARAPQPPITRVVMLDRGAFSVYVVSLGGGILAL